MGKKFFLMLVFFGIQLSVFLLGCSSQNAAEKTAEKTTVVQGKVASVNSYEAIPTASVQIGNDKVTTGPDGSFSISTKEDLSKTTIEISKPGFVGFSKPLSDYSGDKINLDAFMMPVDTTQEIDPAKSGGNVITDSKGAKVTFPVLSGITEPLIVEMASFNVSTEDINAAPGNLTAIDANGKATNLISQGMLSVAVTGKNSGKQYDLKGYENYVIEIPVTGNPASAPDIIPLWYYDNTTGKWKEEGTAKKDGSVYRGTVTHFTVWNTDVQYTGGCAISGSIAYPNPVSGESYEIKLIGNGFAKTFIQQDSTFSLQRLPLSTNITVEVKRISTQEVWSKDFTTPATEGNTLDLGVFPGPGYLSNVYSFKAVREIGAQSATLNWVKPSSPDFTGVEISYAPSGSGTPASPVKVSADTLSQKFTNLAPNTMYVFTIRALYTGSRSSQGLSRSVYIYSKGDVSCKLIIDNTNCPQCGDVYVTTNGNRTLYTNTMSVPNGSSVQLEAFPNTYYHFHNWSGDIDATSNPVTFIMNSDKNIITNFWAPS